MKHHTVFFTIFFLYFLCVWSIFGGAIARIAAVHVARDEKISIRQALTQAAMHSHYHRGQNATRLRELGGTPPMTDFIVWLHKEHPLAHWD